MMLLLENRPNELRRLARFALEGQRAETLHQFLEFGFLKLLLGFYLV